MGSPARSVRRRRRRHHRRTRPEHQEHRVAPASADSARPGAGVRPVRRQHLPGRAEPGAALLGTAGSRMGAVPYSDPGPVAVRFVDPSRRRDHGRSGAHRRARGPSEGEDGVSAAPSYDAVVIGAGHNGLVAGAYLGRAGLRTLVLERRDRPGGALDLSLTIGRLRSTVISDLRLDQQGLKTITPPVRAFAPQPDGKALTLWGDLARTARSIREWSESDAHAYPTFDRKVRALASFLAHVHAITPPDLGSPSFADALTGVKLARAFRGLGGKDRSREALRVLPMAVADLVEEEFETEVLRGLISARGIRFAAMGPRSPGTVLALLSDSAGNDGGAAGETEYAVGGSVALSDALVKACRSYGTHVRCGAEAARITVGEGRVVGVALSTGEEIEAGMVLPGVDPKRTLLGLVDPVALGRTLAWRGGY